MINNFGSSELEEITKFYKKAFDIFDAGRETPEIKVSFYPYVNINHTIRIRNGKILVRIAEILKSAPLQIQEALAIILVAKLLGKKTPQKARSTYRDYINSEEVQKRALANKREKGRKVLTKPKGKYYDLENIFGKLNLIYFNNSIPATTLSWSTRKTFRRLGHHDSAHNAIVISRSLDNKKVPKFVVEYVVYHEMLHIKHPTKHRNGRRYNHTPEFKHDEEKFMYFDEAEEWISNNGGFLKRSAKKRWF
ncbi:MAG: M48 family metallopeptidase [Pyrinomonadaceae bacterium]|nr:M48 family metallopeptidase [Pyrinomonadaceae bacterium]